MVAFGVSALVFPIISSKLAATGVYTYSFIIAAASCVITLVLTLLLKIPKKAKKTA